MSQAVIGTDGPQIHIDFPGDNEVNEIEKRMRLLFEIAVIGTLLGIGWNQPLNGRFQALFPATDTEETTETAVAPAPSPQQAASPAYSPKERPNPVQTQAAAPAPKPDNSWMWEPTKMDRGQSTSKN